MAHAVTDESLVREAREGNEQALSALLVRYTGFVSLRAAAFRCSFCEQEDLEQEGLIGLLSAVRGFDSTRGASFRTFAGDCVDNRMISFIRWVSRQNRVVGVGESPSVKEDGEDPETVVLGRESYRDLLRTVSECLSPYERRVLGLYVEGLSYGEMGKRLGKSSKSVDNALTRIRGKLYRRFHR